MKYLTHFLTSIIGTIAFLVTWFFTYKVLTNLFGTEIWITLVTFAFSLIVGWVIEFCLFYLIPQKYK